MDHGHYWRIYGTVNIFQIFCKPEAHLKRTVRKRPKVRYDILCTKVLNCCFSIMCQAFVFHVSFQNKRCPLRDAARGLRCFSMRTAIYGAVQWIFFKYSVSLKRIWGEWSLEGDQKCDMAFFGPGRGHVNRGAGAFSAGGHRALPSFFGWSMGPRIRADGPGKKFPTPSICRLIGTLRDNLQKFCNVLWDTTSMRMRRCSLTYPV